MPLDTSIKKVLVIGSGPIVIGQAAEFDYAGAQACRIMKEAGVNVVLCNSNPATIMTDQAMADEIYLEPLTTETIKRIIKKERPDSILAGLGGQTGLTLAMQLDKEGFLQAQGVRLLGTDAAAISRAEDRELFKEAMAEIGQPVIASDIAETVDQALAVAEKIGYPVIVRPAFTLGGAGGGARLGARAEFVYNLLHKPAGYVSATEEIREKTVLELVPKDGRRNLFPVGRLDKDTEGLLLITDDGQLAHQLLSPKKLVDKTYFAVTEGKVVPEDIEKIRVGVDIGDQELTLPGKLEILKSWEENPEQGVASGKDCEGKNVKGDSETMTAKADNEEYKADVEKSSWRSEILLTIQEGRFHQVKRMMEAVGKKVIYLKRISMGSLTLPDDLPKGRARELTPGELAALRLGK